jgi:hypothetical protein
MKYAMLMCLALSGCGVGSDTAPQDKTMSVRLSFDAVPPSPFVLGPSGTQATSAPVVTFVTGPVVGPVAVVNPPIVVVNPTTPPINWCTDGFVIGPCVPPVTTCKPDAAGFVAGPCGG